MIVKDKDTSECGKLQFFSIFEGFRLTQNQNFKTSDFDPIDSIDFDRVLNPLFLNLVPCLSIDILFIELSFVVLTHINLKNSHPGQN